MKVGLCLFLVRFQGSNEDGVEIGAGRRCSCGRSLSRSLRHSNDSNVEQLEEMVREGS